MTEKEFLDKYIGYLEDKAFIELIDIREDVESCTNSFLEEHHKEYYEVEFIEKDEIIKMHDKVLTKADYQALDFVASIPEE